MNGPVFADAGYWIALTSGSDSLHHAAIKAATGIASRRVITSQMVLTEFLDGAANMGEFRRVAAAAFVRKLEQDGQVTVVPASADLFEAAVGLYERRPDKAWGLTDCASIVICETEGVSEVLAHDRHFEQAGLIALLR